MEKGAQRNGKNLPRSAYDLVEDIYNKAKRENNDTQLIKSSLYLLGLSSSFEDKDPANYNFSVRISLTELSAVDARAIHHSLLGQLYYHYAQNNTYRFRNRTQEIGDDKNELANMSLEEIMQKSLFSLSGFY